MQQLNAAEDTGISRDYASYDFPYRYNLTTAAKLVREISLKGLLERYGAFCGSLEAINTTSIISLANCMKF